MRKFVAVGLLLVALVGGGYGFDPATSVRQDLMRYSTQDAIDMSINVSYLFIPQIIEFEKQGIGIFGSCKVFTDPLTPEKLGLSYEENGVIDTIKGQYLQGLQGSYAPVGYLTDEKKVVEYANCLLQYGAILAQAQLNLYNNLKKVGKVVKGRVKGNVELEAFKRMVRGALYEAMNTKRFSPQIQNVVGKVKVSGPCKFAGGGGNIMCGGFFLKLQVPQELSWQGFSLFGPNAFGVGGSIRVSKAAGSENTAFEYIPVGMHR
jgi:hypothetical protein